MGLLNLEEQLTFYGKYHNNDINKIIHIVCVPLILWSFLVWAANTGPLLPYEEDSLWRLTPFEPNLALLVVLLYIFYYILLEPVAGALYTPLLLFMAYNATNFTSSFPDNHNSLAGIVHVASWILQFIGHGFAEKRSPALKDNVAQASSQTNQSTTVLTQQTFENEGFSTTAEKGGGFLDNTFKMTGYRKRRLSKIPAPVIIPPPSPIITAPSPVSPAKSDTFIDIPSPKTPQSPTKRFVLKPITALTAAFQRTTLTGRRSTSTSFLKFPKSQSNNNPKSPKPSSPQSPKPPKSPKLLHRKGSSGSIRKRSESPTSPAVAATAASFLSPNLAQSPSNASKPSFLFGKSFSLSVNTSIQSSAPKSPSKLGKLNLKLQKSSSPCRKALPMVPSELAERLRESSSRSAKVEDERVRYYYDENDCSIIRPTLTRSPKPILIDVRNLPLYQDDHVRDSFNVNLPTLLIKRYRRGNMSNFSLDSFITTPEGRDKYLDTINEDGGKFHHDVIIYDETMDEKDKVSPGWTLLSVLERSMLNYHSSSSDSIDENIEVPRGRVYWLRGGFEAFRSWDQRGEFIVTESDVASSDNDDGNSMEFDQEQQQGSNLVRRDSLFSVNTERNSLRRKKSGRQPKSEQNSLQETPPSSETIVETSHIEPVEVSRQRRPSNGLQYLFTPSSGKFACSYGVHDYQNGNQFDPVSPNTPPPLTHPEAAFVVSTIIPGFLFLGPEITREGEVDELKDKGVMRILNMAFECEDCLGLKDKFDRYLKLNVKDSVEEDVENGLNVAVNFIERAHNDNTPIYVHCKAGRSRSVTAVLAYLIKSRNWTLKHAYDYVMDRRSGICPNIGFVAELMKVEELVLGIKRNCGAATEFDLRRKEDMMDMEGVEPLGKVPKTAYF
ncbi:18504_t:CDS:2 [Funneliformis geosporum]|uniref:protein-tyrosine-phosphatase n=1 Tax=Funneliformis geosporum TaxID=1117311 RepID=A0A9W4SEN1_9GLOM|nr:18504_t:CDS:2 [Funneliformis geosporum]